MRNYPWIFQRRTRLFSPPFFIVPISSCFQSFVCQSFAENELKDVEHRELVFFKVPEGKFRNDGLSYKVLSNLKFRSNFSLPAIFILLSYFNDVRLYKHSYIFKFLINYKTVKDTKIVLSRPSQQNSWNLYSDNKIFRLSESSVCQYY